MLSSEMDVQINLWRRHHPHPSPYPLPYSDEADDRYVATGNVAVLEESVAGWEVLLQHPDFERASLDFRLS